MGDMFERLHSAVGKKRVQMLTTDTHLALVRTTRGVHALALRLISESHFDYVLLGHVQSDLLESEFGIWRHRMAVTCL